MKRRAIIIVAVFAVLSLGAMAATGKLGGKKADGPKAVPVVRGTLVDKALAVGTIEPRVEVSVKSILAGVVRQRFAAVGDFVKRGQSLLEISPNPTPLEMVELRRNVELREIELKNLERDLARQQELRSRNLISPADIEAAQQRVDESRNQLSLAQERLALQEGGKVLTGGKQVETVVRAPIDGYILEVTIKIGALPNASVKGRLEKIWLKAHKQEQATVFPIEIVLTEVAGATLRAGYSANAEVTISRRDSVLYIPERLITHRHDSSFVTVRTGPGKTQERWIKTGLSDAINIEVLEGLQVTDSIVEPTPREIS